MKATITLITLSLALVSCGKSGTDSSSSKSRFQCNDLADNLLAGVRSGDSIHSYTGHLKTLFDEHAYSEYTSGSYCSRTYDFNQYNTDTYEWCYYYSITTNCNGVVKSVYVGE